jgi:F-type H+-transporting ATPase subunit a
MYKRMLYSFLKLCVFIVFLGISLPKTANAAPTSHEKEDSKLDIGGVIISHIVNAYEWHIATVKGKHISIPLPVIIVDKEGFHVFSSGKFHHGHESYMGYAICQEKSAKKGRIVKIDEEGNQDTEASFLDISITKNVLSLLISIALLLTIFVSVAKGYKKRGVSSPKGIARIVEPIVLFIRDDVVRPSIGPKYERYLPYLLTLFFFILINNFLGIVPFFPGGANLTGNINITLVLALITFIITLVSSNLNYWKHIVNTPGVPWWLKIPVPLIPLIETIGVFTKPFVLMVRLFANMTAGHVICLGFISLIFVFGGMFTALGFGVSPISVFFYIFMTLIELLVAFIQAFVFTLLSAIYIGMAVEEHHEDAHEIKHSISEAK